jgi:hypothetical protein
MDWQTMSNEMKMVWVEWSDAVSVDDWEDKEMVSGCPIVRSCGFLLKEDDKTIALALNHDVEGDRVSCAMIIPKVLVRRKLTLVVDNTKKTT